MATPEDHPIPRAADARPRVVLFDVFETLLALEPLRQRFVDVGRPPHELELFFARTLRDGMALTLAGTHRRSPRSPWRRCAPHRDTPWTRPH